jgi:xanthine/CO dehydrogenase XdhC/CoxF family maturation factor
MRDVLVGLRSPAGYVRAMGSTRTQNTRRERMLDAGRTMPAVDT